MDSKEQRINEQIQASQVRVIGVDGAQLGIMATPDAIAAASEDDLDLVEVAPFDEPPVCRIMDFGKFKYQQKKRQQQHKTHQVKTKEIRLRPKTGEHDISVKVNHARDILSRRDKVLLSVTFQGREMAHIDEGYCLIAKIIAQLEDVSKIEATPTKQGHCISCTLVPM